MNPELTGFALGLLLGAAKVMTIGTIGFGIAWWRARLRVRALETDLREADAQIAALKEEQAALLVAHPEHTTPRLPGATTLE